MSRGTKEGRVPPTGLAGRGARRPLPGPPPVWRAAAHKGHGWALAYLRAVLERSYRNRVAEKTAPGAATHCAAHEGLDDVRLDEVGLARVRTTLDPNHEARRATRKSEAIHRVPEARGV